MKTQEYNYNKYKDIIENGYEFNTNKYITKGYYLFMQNIKGFVQFSLLILLLQIFIGLIHNPGIEVVMNFIVFVPLTAGFYFIADRIYKHEKYEFKDFFLGFNYFKELLIYSLVTSAFILAGSFLLIIPGIYLAVAYTFGIFFVIFKKIDFWQAMEISRKIITKNWFAVFGFILILILINILGIILFGIGLLVSIPLTYCSIYIAFQDVVETEQNKVTDNYDYFK
jgi:uncharacterized membrane protein